MECQADNSKIMREGTPIGEVLDFGTMSPHFLKASNEMPWRISTRAPLDIGLGSKMDSRLDSLGLDLYAVPDAGLVGMLSLVYTGSVASTVDLLDHLTFSRKLIAIDSKLLPEILSEDAAPVCVGDTAMGQDMFHIIDVDPDCGILTENITEIPPDPWPKELDLAMATKLVYKIHDAVRPRFTSLKMPMDANRHREQVACVALTGALLVGQPHWFQQCAVGSSIISIAAFSRLRNIRREAFDALRQLDATKSGVMNQSRRELSHTRTALAGLSERLASLDVDLASGVDAKLDLTAVLPSPRLASYHSSVVESMGITTGSKYVANLVDRLRYSIAAQRDAITAAERQLDEERRAEISVLAGALSTIAIIFGIFFGFFGTNSEQVNSRYSLLDHHYLGFYLLLVGIALSIFGLFMSLRLKHRIRNNSRRASGPSQLEIR